MTTGHIFIATSLDGYVARKTDDPEHRLDWLMKQDTIGEDHGYDDFMDHMDGLVMGRGSFETLLAFTDWPYQKPVIVMSQTLEPEDIPTDLEGKVELTSLSPKDVMNMLDKRGWGCAYIDGGKIIQSFLREGLITDLTITRIPILIGNGLALFGDLDGDIDLKHIKTQVFESGLVSSQYAIGQNAMDAS